MKSTWLALVLVLLASIPAAAQTGPRVAHQPSATRPFSAAVQAGDIFWLSGRLGATAETRAMATGRTAAETHNINEAYAQYFPSEAPARVTVAVSDLVGGAAIEISFVAVRD